MKYDDRPELSNAALARKKCVSFIKQILSRYLKIFFGSGEIA